jgi:anti-sigma-K factor RskA
MTHNEDNYEDLPRELLDELKSSDEPVPMITSRVDREIMQQARLQFASRKRRSRASYPAWAAVAAVILVAVFVTRMDSPPLQDQPGVYADHDNSGRIDIADVLHLARTGGADQANIDAFAMQVVALSTRGETS